MTTEHPLRRPRSWTEVSGVAAFVLMVVVFSVLLFVVLDTRSADRGAQRQAESVAACERGNLLRGYLLLRARQLPPTAAGSDLAPHVLALPNCYETTHHLGEVLLLSPASTETYLRILSTKRWPIVSNQGQVIGDRPLPDAQ